MAAAAVPAVALVAGCAATPRAPAGSCMQQAVDGLVLDGLADARKHCLASATIAARCGNFDAVLAAWAKEASDALGPGDASRADLAADAAGRRCAGRSGAAAGPAGLADCCAEAGY